MKQWIINALVGTALIVSGCSPSANELAGGVMAETLQNMAGAPSMMRNQHAQSSAQLKAKGKALVIGNRKIVMVMGCQHPRYPLIIYPGLSSVQSHLSPNMTEEDLKRGVVMDNHEICGLPGACYTSSTFNQSRQELAEFQECAREEQKKMTMPEEQPAQTGKIMAYVAKNKTVTVEGCTDPVIFYPDFSLVQPWLPSDKTEEELLQGVVVDNPEICKLPVPEECRLTLMGAQDPKASIAFGRCISNASLTVLRRKMTVR